MKVAPESPSAGVLNGGKTYEGGASSMDELL